LPVLFAQNPSVSERDSLVRADLLHGDQLPVGEALARSRSGVGFELESVAHRQHKLTWLTDGQPIYKSKRDGANLLHAFQNQTSIGDTHEATALSFLEHARVSVQHQNGVVLVEPTVALLRLRQIDCFQRRHCPVFRAEKSTGFQGGAHVLVHPVNLRPGL
jgi:hypothetical protein